MYKLPVWTFLGIGMKNNVSDEHKRVSSSLPVKYEHQSINIRMFVHQVQIRSSYRGSLRHRTNPQDKIRL